MIGRIKEIVGNYSPLGLAGMAAALVLAGAAGVFTAVALGVGAQGPAKTVTINVATGPAGPRGEQGPAGPSGPPGVAGPAGLACPAGYDPGVLVINHPTGQVQIWTCLKQ